MIRATALVLALSGAVQAQEVGRCDDFRSSAQAIVNDDRDINVWMTADGAVYLDEEPVDVATLRATFRERASKDPSTLVVIKADEGVSHGRVVRIMDQAKSFGLSRLAIATEAGTEEEEEQEK